MTKLMIVDDSSTMRKIILRALNRGGFKFEQALEASNGLEALDHIESTPGIDLVVTDVNMPDMHGIDLLKKVRESRSADELAVIVVSAEGGDERRAEALDAGANGYLTKPFTPESIVAALSSFLR